MKEEYIGRFRGTSVIVKPDIEITEIVLPESLVTYILQLQDNKVEYFRKELKSIFPNIDI